MWIQGVAPAEVLKAFGSRIPANPTNGLFSHLAVSAIYGIVWAFLLNTALRTLRAPRWLLGILYGLLLFAFAELLVAPSALLDAVSTAALLIAHIVYGAALGLLSGRRWLQ
jgi:hypothetical protein